MIATRKKQHNSYARDNDAVKTHSQHQLCEAAASTSSYFTANFCAHKQTDDTLNKGRIAQSLTAKCLGSAVQKCVFTASPQT